MATTGRIRMGAGLLVLTWAVCGLTGTALAGEPAKPNPATDWAQVIAATFLGGDATDWLCAGGFAPDGKVVVAGVTLGSDVTAAGVKASVLGDDAPPVPAPPPAPAPADKAAGSKFMWNRPDATAFVAILSPDLGKVLTVRRLPRGSGSATSAAVAKDGSIYLAGGATDRTAKLASDSKTLPVTQHEHREFDCEATYVAKLAPDASRILWVRRMDGKSVAPKLRVLPDGSILMTGPDVRTFDVEGNVRKAAHIEMGITGSTAVSPKDGTICRVGEWMTKTGREPWRCPHLHLFAPEGALRYQLYSWPPPFVGLNTFRLVADSTFRRAAYDDDGNLVITGWSHGGNTVNNRLPQDLERPWPYDGLGGHVANSCNFIIKHEPNDFRVIAATSWSGGKTWSLGTAADGSVVWNGTPSHLTPRTHPDLTACDSNEDVVAVTDPAMRKYRFFVPMPACARNVVVGAIGKVPEPWGFATGIVGGKARLLLLTGAAKSEQTSKGEHAPPMKNAVQPAFGGGALDGFALLMELPPSAPAAAPEPAAPAALAKPAPVDESKLTVQQPKRMPKQPEEGQVFEMKPVRYKTVMIVFRDPTDKLWPSFFYGDPEGETSFKYTTKEKQALKIPLVCKDVANAKGLQDRRVLGDNVKDDKIVGEVRFTATDMSPWRWEETYTIRGTSKLLNYRAACDIKGELAVGDRKLAVSGPCTLALTPNKEFPHMSELNLRFTIKGSDLGLKAPQAQGDIQVRVNWSGWEQGHGKPGERG